MKLDKRIVDRRVQLMRDEGIEFVTGVEVGKDIPAKQPHRRVRRGRARHRLHRAARPQGRGPRRGGHPLRDGLPAREHQVACWTRSTRTARSSPPRTSDVVVIGGGDTGTDCVGTSIRHGATERGAAGDHEPAARRARPGQPVAAVAQGLQAGLRAGGGQGALGRRPAPVRGRPPSASSTDAAGQVTGLEIVEVDWAGRARRARRASRRCQARSGRSQADLVLLALGFLGPEQSLPEQLGCELDPRGNILADADKQTTVPGVFTAGDCTRGQSLVVWAINEGRAAARGVDQLPQGRVPRGPLAVGQPDRGGRALAVVRDPPDGRPGSTLGPLRAIDRGRCPTRFPTSMPRADSRPRRAPCRARRSTLGAAAPPSPTRTCPRSWTRMRPRTPPLPHHPARATGPASCGRPPAGTCCRAPVTWTRRSWSSCWAPPAAASRRCSTPSWARPCPGRGCCGPPRATRSWSPRRRTRRPWWSRGRSRPSRPTAWRSARRVRGRAWSSWTHRTWTPWSTTTGPWRTRSWSWPTCASS